MLPKRISQENLRILPKLGIVNSFIHTINITLTLLYSGGNCGKGTAA